MKSPFVRFNQFVRSTLSLTTLGLCSLGGCRHLPTSSVLSESDEIVYSEPSTTHEQTFINANGPEVPTAPIESVIEQKPIEQPVAKTPYESDDVAPIPPKSDVPLASPAAIVPMEPAPVETKKPVKVNVNKPAQKTLPEETVIKKAAPKRAKKPAPKVIADPPKSDQPEQAEAKDKPDDKPAVPPKLEVPPEPTPKKTNSPKSDKTQSKEADLPLPEPQPKEATLLDDEKLFPLDATTKTDDVKTPERVVAAVTKEAVATKEPLKPVPVESVKDLEPILENQVINLESHCDGLVFDAQGFGYVSHKNQIVRFSPTGDQTVWATLNKPKGHRIEPEGTHLVCDLERRVIVRMSFDGNQIGVAAKECDGAPLRVPYDIAVDPKGGFYFTDPGYVQIKNPIGKLHYVDRSGHVSVVAAKLGYPTGLVYDADRQRVLVAESLGNRIVEFRLSEAGKIESHQVLAELPKTTGSDYHLSSLCLDSEGCVYVTQQHSKTIHAFDVQGRPVGTFSTGEIAPSSVALRSSDADVLFLTGEVEGRERISKVIRLNLGK